MAIDDLFPPTRDRAPVRWLSHVGGLALWGLSVCYERHGSEVAIYAVIFVPDRATGMPTSIRSSRTFHEMEFDQAPSGRAMVVDWVRGFVLHEALEGLLVDGKPFYQREIDRDHKVT